MKKLFLAYAVVFLVVFSACGDSSSTPSRGIDEHGSDSLSADLDSIDLDDEDFSEVDNSRDSVSSDSVQNDSGCSMDEMVGQETVSCGDTSLPVYKGLCDSISYDPKLQFCYEGLVMDFCEGAPYNPSKNFCHNDTLYVRCGEKGYDPKNQFCNKEIVYSLCGGKTFDPKTQYCLKGEVLDYCGTKAYDPQKEFCQDQTVAPFCSGEKYDITKEFCFGNITVMPLCNGNSYNALRTFCYKDSLYDRCGNSIYDPSIEFCFKDSVYYLCAEAGSYDPESGEECLSSDGGVTWKVHKPCGNTYIEKENEFCFMSSAYSLCNGTAYDPGKYYCKDRKTLTEYEYLTDARDGQKYRVVEVGGLKWMAQNLNYDYNEGTAESFCYDDDPENCIAYGRLYKWSAVMDSAGVFSGYTQGCGYETTCVEMEAASVVRGVCPEGWFVPSKAEWENLINTIGDEYAGLALKSPTDWKLLDEYAIGGRDWYGFSALPAGKRLADGSYSRINQATGFWTRDESSSLVANYVILAYSNQLAPINVVGKYQGLSVRCVEHQTIYIK